MKKLLFLILITCFFSKGYAQVVAWNLVGATGSETTSASNVNNPNMEQSVLSRSSGVVASAAGASFASTWPQIAAQSETCYYEFTVKPKAGYVAALSTIDVKLRIQTAGPKTYIWKYSLDGGANFTDIGTPYTWATPVDFANNDGVQQPTINLSGITDLQEITAAQPVIFRVYAWQSTNATSGFRIGKSLSTSEHALAIGGVVTSTAAPVVAWNLFGAVGDEATSVANAGDANMEQTVLSRGSGVVASAAGASFASTWPQIATQSETCYYEFTIKPKTGYTASLSTILAKLRIQTNGPRTYIWKYSLDGGANFVDIGSANTWTTTLDFSNNDGVQQPGVDLSGITALQHIPSTQAVVFRIYAWQSGNATSTFRIGKSLTVTENSLFIGGTVTGVLPVKLTNFTGKLEGSAVRLNWTTASEDGNSHFEVLRSATGKPNVVIGRIDGNGTTGKTNTYSFVDQNPIGGDNYYQLRQVDLNGDKEEFSIINVRTGLKPASLSVYVPSDKDQLQFNVFSLYGGKAKILVTDINGRKLSEKEYLLEKGYTNLSTPINAATGICIAVLKTDKENLRTKFLIN